MRPVTRRVHDFLNNTWTLLVLALFAAVGVVLPFFGDITVGRTFAAWTIHLAATVVLFAALVYSFRVRQENIVLRRVPATVHSVNHNYRDVLCTLFGDRQNPPTDDLRVKAEVRVLESVCQRLAGVFRDLVRMPCMVSVKLITKEGGQAYCTTLVRSETLCARDALGETQRFSLNTGANTTLDEALRYQPGRKSYFYSADLTKEREGSYNNDRRTWKSYYRSEIVCPIRYVKPDVDGRPPTSDDIGFLIVDTLSTNRLNEAFHLELLGACADQMYNFMSLMRGKYSVSPLTAEEGTETR